MPRVPVQAAAQFPIRRQQDDPDRGSGKGMDDPCEFRLGRSGGAELLTRGKRPEPLTSCRLSASKQAGPVCPGFGSKTVRSVGTMGSVAYRERSAKHRASMAAGGTFSALRPRPGDAINSGTHMATSSWRGMTSSRPGSPAAGGKRYNAQQDDDRRLPPGGNPRRSRSR